MSVLCACSTRAAGQPAPKRYTIVCSAGALSTLAQRGPKTQTEVSEVRFVRPVSKSLSLGFDFRYNSNYTVGLVLGYEEFNFGYEGIANRSFQGLGIASGLLSANDILGFYKAGLRLSRIFPLNSKFSLNSGIAPMLGFLPFSSFLNDTSANSHFRTPRSSVWYIVQPTYQDNRLKFLLSFQVGCRYRINSFLNVGIAIEYQQGFTPIVIDSTIIVRPYEPGGIKQHTYWTKVNGTAAGGKISLGFNF